MTDVWWELEKGAAKVRLEERLWQRYDHDFRRFEHLTQERVEVQVKTVLDLNLGQSQEDVQRTYLEPTENFLWQPWCSFSWNFVLPEGVKVRSFRLGLLLDNGHALLTREPLLTREFTERVRRLPQRGNVHVARLEQQELLIADDLVKRWLRQP